MKPTLEAVVLAYCQEHRARYELVEELQDLRAVVDRRDALLRDIHEYENDIERLRAENKLLRAKVQDLIAKIPTLTTSKTRTSRAIRKPPADTEKWRSSFDHD